MKNAPVITLSIGVLLVTALMFLDNPPAPINIFAASEPGSIIAPRSQVGKEIQNILSGEAPTLPPEEEENLTRDAAVSIANSLLSDSTFLQGGDISPEALAQKIIDSGLKLSETDFHPVVNESDLHVIENPNLNDYETYDNLFSKIIEKYFSIPKINLQSLSPDEFTKLRDATRALVVGTYAVPVPSNLKLFHTEFIRALLIQEEAFENLISFEADPLKAVTSVKVIDESHKQITNLIQALVSASSQ